MRRYRFSLPSGHSVEYRHLDLLHDALVAAWTVQGVPSERICGPAALPWNFAPLGFHRGKTGRVHTLVVSTPSPELADALDRLRPEDIRYARVATDEAVDFGLAAKQPDSDPIAPQQGHLSVFLLSPLAIRRPDRRWHANLAEVDLNGAVNTRLARLAGRPVALSIQPDSLYLRANPRHSVLVSLKGGSGGYQSFVIGMQAPLVLAGSDQDLRLAWYAGIGEKTRTGFGCIGLFERGLGR
jgi:CRISPR-associated endoribonuclease Cas6